MKQSTTLQGINDIHISVTGLSTDQATQIEQRYCTGAIQLPVTLSPIFQPERYLEQLSQQKMRAEEHPLDARRAQS